MQTEIFDIPPRDAPIGAIEQWASASGRTPAMGVDEAGRGPLAGPVVSAAVVLPPGPLPPSLSTLDDSKRLTERARERLLLAIVDAGCTVGVGRASAAEIDQLNILEATRESMRRAIARASARLGRAPMTVLVDGHLPIPGLGIEQWPLVKGDGRSFAIAAASIVAKVVRDRLMVAAHRRYPAYGFDRHKGYGTKAHRAALSCHGPSPVHRRSFKWTPPDDR